jgi:hypothetical protein
VVSVKEATPHVNTSLRFATVVTIWDDISISFAEKKSSRSDSTPVAEISFLERVQIA